MTEKKIKNIYKYKYIWNIFFFVFFYFIYLFIYLFLLLLFSGTQLRICVQVATPLCINLKKMCMMCVVLSPNCCAETIFEYSTTEVTLPSCLSVSSEHFALQSKWQSADLDLVKLAKKRKSVWPALFWGNVCI